MHPGCRGDPASSIDDSGGPDAPAEPDPPRPSRVGYIHNYNKNRFQYTGQIPLEESDMGEYDGSRTAFRRIPGRSRCMKSTLRTGEECNGSPQARHFSPTLGDLLDVPVHRIWTAPYKIVSARGHASRCGGLALTFDDSSSIQGWYSIRELLRKYRSPVTFFIDRIDMIGDEDLALLRTLAGDGHEIGCHGFRHRKAEDFLMNHSVHEYIEVEIEPAIQAMHARGFGMPQSFAHPYGSYTWELNRALSPYFRMIRGVAEDNAPLHADLRTVDRIYYSFNGDRTVWGAGLDQWYENPVETVVPAMDRAAETGEVLILYAHRPVAVEDGLFTTSIEKIETLLQHAVSRGLKFYRICDLQ